MPQRWTASAAALACGLAVLATGLPAAAGDMPRRTKLEIADDEPRLPGAPSRVGTIRRGAGGEIEVVDPAKGGAGRLCASDALCVGKNQAYPSLRAALAAARDGDIIEVTGGTYRESVEITRRRLTIRGVAGVPHFDCTGLRLAHDLACFVLVADAITLDNLEISGATLPLDPSANGACVGNDYNLSFTLNRIICHASQVGVLANGGTILIEHSEFFDNGWSEATHNADLGGNCQVTVRGSIFRDARAGHEFKSRCTQTSISDSTFRSTSGSRALDIADGGETFVYRSTLLKAMAAAKDDIIAFAAESCTHPGDMVLKEVRIINSQSKAGLHNFNTCEGHAIILQNVTLEGTAPKQIGLIKGTLTAVELPVAGQP